MNTIYAWLPYVGTAVILGTLAGMAWMFATAPLVDADGYPVDETPDTQDDPRLVEALREGWGGLS